MGLFDRLSPRRVESTVAMMCDAYNGAVAHGSIPREALCIAFQSIAARNEGLENLGAEGYLNGVFEEDFRNMSRDPAVARSFVADAIHNVITSYLHPEEDNMGALLEGDISVLGRPDRVADLIEKRLR